MSEVEKFFKNLNLVFTCFVILSCLSFLYIYVFDGGKDRTDSPSLWGMRSGLKWHLDHETGCQYLSTPEGYLIQRSDKKGKQVCGEVTIRPPYTKVR